MLKLYWLTDTDPPLTTIVYCCKDHLCLIYGLARGQFVIVTTQREIRRLSSIFARISVSQVRREMRSAGNGGIYCAEHLMHQYLKPCYSIECDTASPAASISLVSNSDLMFLCHYQIYITVAIWYLWWIYICLVRWDATCGGNQTSVLIVRPCA